MISDGPLFHKPKSFFAARQVLYANIFLGVLQFLFIDFTVGIANNGGIMPIIIIAASYVILIWLIKEMSFCKKWARTALLVVSVFSMLAFLIILYPQLKTSLLQMAVLVIQVALQIYALILLYNKECTTWFNSVINKEILP